MTVVFAEEKSETCLAEIKSLINQAWEEVGHGSLEDKPPRPNWDTYRKLEVAGKVTALTVRDAGGLVGYCTLFFSEALHHLSAKKAYTDSLYLRPEHRGMNGIRLIQEAEKVAKRRGVSELDVQVTDRVNFGRMLGLLGFSLQAYTYSKELKDA